MRKTDKNKASHPLRKLGGGSHCLVRYNRRALEEVDITIVSPSLK
jgi:hypothetical protein